MDAEEDQVPLLMILEGSERKEEGEPPVTIFQEIDNNIGLHLLAHGGTSPSTRTSGRPISTLRSIFSYKEVFFNKKPGNFDQTKLQSRTTYLCSPEAQRPTQPPSRARTPPTHPSAISPTTNAEHSISRINPIQELNTKSK